MAHGGLTDRSVVRDTRCSEHGREKHQVVVVYPDCKGEGDEGESVPVSVSVATHDGKKRHPPTSPSLQILLIVSANC
jgi:hypothetical protein